MIAINLESPDCRKETIEYYKRKCELYEEKSKENSAQPIRLNKSWSQINGSMEGSKYLELWVWEAAENDHKERK